METKILFTDLDGTLLNDNKEISPGNQAAIDEALAQGHKIVICTGRPLSSAWPQAQKLGLIKEGCYAIAYNGGQIYDTYRQTTVYGKTVPLNLVAPLFQEAHARKIHIQTYSDTHILSAFDTPELHHYVGINHIPFQLAEDISTLLTANPYKLLAIELDHPEKLVKFQQEVISRYDGILDSFFSNESFFEIVPVGISKGFAVRWMCEFLGIPLENSVAAGDAQNDIAMLEAAHVGAVMCNAFPGIAEHGNYITKADNNHDGVAEIIHKFILCD